MQSNIKVRCSHKREERIRVVKLIGCFSHALEVSHDS